MISLNKGFRKLLLTVLFCGISLSLFGQKEKVRRQPYMDLKPYYWGYKLGINTQDLQIENSGFIDPQGLPYFADVSSYKLGFTVGVFAAKVFYPGYELKLGLDLSFGDKTIAYTDGHKTIQNVTHRLSQLTLPLQFKYCAIRLNNIRPYIAFGPYLSYHIGSKKTDIVRYKALDYGLSCSVGCDFYFSFFKLSPELSFSYGLTDVIRHNRPALADDRRIYFTNAIAGGQSRMIMLSFNFQ